MNAIHTIQNKIYEVRGIKVMLDFDLAALYEVETRVFNQAVKRNIENFPEDFMFQLTRSEYNALRSQFVTLEDQSADSQYNVSPNTLQAKGNGRGKYTKYLPYAFTEHGVAMLASVLKSAAARKMSIAIVRAFITMRRMILQYAEVVKVIDELKDRMDGHDEQLNQIYDALENMLDKRAAEEIEKNKWENRTRIGFKK
ncbi:MAG: ORF6N domain-containing protein [Niabella sp.]